jgi:GNAT superfamily N-acetyltransferase
MTNAIVVALPDDIAQLVAIDPFARTDPGRCKEIAGAIADGRCLLLRDGDGAAVAFAIFGVWFFGAAFIELFYVAEPKRRSGYGRALLRHLDRMHRDEKLFTSTNQSNAPMRALLEAEGFVPSGVIENLDPGDPELVYCRLPDTAG